MSVDYEAIQKDPALRRGLYGLSELTGLLNLDANSSAAKRTSTSAGNTG